MVVNDSVHDIFVVPLLAGLSSGIYCIIYCLPFVAPVMVFENRERREGIWIIARFILGRFVGYLLFGAVVGYLGERFSGLHLNKVVMAAMALLSLILILHAFGLWQAGRSGLCAAIKKYDPKIPLLMGLLMGVNVCPPFLLSITYVFTLHSALEGVIYFLMFFIGTTVYFIPALFLSYLGKIREFQIVGRISAIIVGILFLGYSLYNITYA